MSGDWTVGAGKSPMGSSVTEPETARFQALVLRLLAAKGALLHGFDGRSATIYLPGRLVAVLRDAEGEADEALLAGLRAWTKSYRGPLFQIILVGGAASRQRVLKAAQPFFQIRTRVQVGQIDREGRAFTGGGGLASPLKEALRDVAGAAPPPLRDLAAFAAEMAAARERGRALAAEARAFSSGLRAGRPWATYALGAAIVACFGLEMLWGGSETTPTLMRLGAAAPARVREGEVWRLLSAAFLHAGLLHVAGNLFVLHALGGRFIEPILGARRFIVLFGVSAFAGGLASTLFSRAPLSVGASGALWGILGAHAVLGFRPAGLLPELLVPAVRKAALVNLGLNLAISFHPRVDAAAHIGGGVAGALLMLTGVLTLGTRRIASGGGEGPPRGALVSIPASRALGWAAAIVAAALAGSVGLAIAKGRPYELTRPAAVWHRQPLGDTSMSVLIPAILLPQAQVETGEGADSTEYVFGDLGTDPLVVAVAPIALEGEPRSAEERDAVIEEHRRELDRFAPGGAARRGPGARLDAGGFPALRASYELPGGLAMERWLKFERRTIFQVDVVWWTPLLPHGPNTRLMIESARAGGR